MLAHLAVLQECIAASLADHEAVVWRDRRYTYADLTARTRQVGRALLRPGFGCRTASVPGSGRMGIQRDHWGVPRGDA